jgi:peptide-methionine (S)-S-oxide reductase
VITFERLLEVFWAEHDPTARAWSTQYKAILFFHDEAQERAARASVTALEARLGRRITTEVKKLDRFYLAEDYHQKYSLRHDRVLMSELARLVPDPASFVASTAAMRLNAWLAGHVTKEQLERDLPLLGLTPAGQEHIRRELGSSIGCR